MNRATTRRHHHAGTETATVISVLLDEKRRNKCVVHPSIVRVTDLSQGRSNHRTAPPTYLPDRVLVFTGCLHAIRDCYSFA